MSALADILVLLPNLTTDELVRLRERIGATLSMGGGARASVRQNVENAWVTQTILDQMALLGIERLGSEQLQGTREWRRFRPYLPELLAYLGAVGERRRDQEALLSIGVQLLYHELRRLQAGSPGAIIRNLRRLPSIIDQHFPGYAANRLLKHIVARELDHVRPQSSSQSQPRPQGFIGGQ